jgi:hypothetical protein
MQCRLNVDKKQWNKKMIDKRTLLDYSFIGVYMEIYEKILFEIKQIKSIDFWEDCLLFDYEKIISEQNKNIQENIFDYLLCNIDMVDNKNNYFIGFILDILTLPVFDSEIKFLKLLNKCENYNEDYILEKIIDNLRRWNITKEQKEQLFSLKNNIKNKSSLIYEIIKNENTK